MKSLVVDDDDVSRDVIQAILSKFGECDGAKNGEEAVTLFQNAWSIGLPYELISMDIMMPQMDGIKTLERIRILENDKEIPDEKKVKIIMVTCKSDPENVKQSMLKGCNQFIVKPVKKKVLKEKLKNLGFPVI